MAVTEKKITHNQNFQGQEVRFPVLHPLASDPANYDIEGQLYFNTTVHNPKFYDGTAWRTIPGLERNHTVSGTWTFTAAPSFPVNFTVGLTTQIDNLNAEFLQGRVPSVTAVANTIALRDGGGRTQVAFPVADQDAANKLYVDMVVEGKTYEEPVRVAVSTNVNIANPGTATFDGVTISVGDRVLLRGQTNPVQNGIYDFNGSGTAMTRSADADEPNVVAVETVSNRNILNPGTSTFGGTPVNTDDIIALRAQSDPSENGTYKFNGPGSAMTPWSVFGEIKPGSAVFVREGTVNGGAQFTVSSPQAIRVIIPGTDQQVWTQSNAQNVYSADGNGLELDGTVFSLELDATPNPGGAAASLSKSANGLKISDSWDGSTSINTLGTVDTGVWEGTTVAAGYGGTGHSTYTTGDLLYASGSAALSRLAIGASGRYLRSNGSSPSWDDLTPGDINAASHPLGRVFFSDGVGLTTRPEFIYDYFNDRLGIGSGTSFLEIDSKLHIMGDTDAAITLEQTASVTGRAKVAVGTASGNLLYTANAGGTGSPNVAHTWKYSSADLMSLSPEGYLKVGGTPGTYNAKFEITTPPSGVKAAVIGLADNLAKSFEILQGDQHYMSINTTNGVEAVWFGQPRYQDGVYPGADFPIDYRFFGAGTTIFGDAVMGSTPIPINHKVFVDGDMYSNTFSWSRIGRAGGWALDRGEGLTFPEFDLSGASGITISIDLKYYYGAQTTSIQPIISGPNFTFAIYKDQEALYYVVSEADGQNARLGISPGDEIPGKTGYTERNITFTGSTSSGGGVTMYLDGRPLFDMISHDLEGMDLRLNELFGTGSPDGELYNVRVWSERKTGSQVLRISQGFNDTNGLELFLNEHSTESWGWRDISGKNRHAIPNNENLIRIESPINKSYTSHSEFAMWQKKDGGYYFDGTSDDAIVTPPLLFDTDFSFIVSAYLTPSPAATQWIISSDNGGTSTRQFELYQTTGGALQLQIGGTNLMTANGPIITSSGVYVIGVSFDESAATAKMYLNGSQVPLTVSANTFTAMGTTALPVRIGDPLRASGDFRGEIHEVRLFNYALDDASITRYSRGEATAFGDRIVTPTVYTQDSTTTGQDGWSASGGTFVGAASVGGRSDVFSFTVNTSSGTKFVQRASSLTVGRRYRVNLDYFIPSTNSHVDGFVLGDGAVFHSTNTSATTDAWTSVTVDFVAAGANFNFALRDGASSTISDASGDDVFYVDGLTIQEIGEVAHYAPTSATTTLWEDTSGLENHAVNNGATLLKPSLQESYVLEQQSIASKVGTGPGYALSRSSAYITLPGTDPVFDFGVSDFSIAYDLSVQSVVSSGTYFLYTHATGNNRIATGYNSSGEWIIFFVNGSGSSSEFSFKAKVNTGPQTHVITADRDGDISLFINGKKVGSVSASPVSGVDFGASNTAIRWINSPTVGLNAVLSSLQSFNRALTESEVALVSNGQNLGFADYGADGSPSYESNPSIGGGWASDTNGWFATNGTVTAPGVSETVGGENNFLKLTINTVNSLHQAYRSGMVTAGKRCRLSARYYIPSSNSHVDGVEIRTSTGSIVLHKDHTPTLDEWRSVTVEFVTDATGLIFYTTDGGSTIVNDTGGNDVLYIKDVVLTPIGIVLDLNEWGMSPDKWMDQSGNGYHGTVTGATLINPRENLYTQFIVDENGVTGLENQILVRTATGMTWQNSSNVSGTGDVLGAGNGLANWMAKWTASDTITKSTLLFDNGTTIGIGYAGDTPTLPAAAKLAVNGVIHASELAFKDGTSNRITFGAGYTELGVSGAAVRLTNESLSPQQTGDDLGSATYPWRDLVYNRTLAMRNAFSAEVDAFTAYDTSATENLFSLKIDNVVAGSGTGASIKFVPRHDSDNNGTWANGSIFSYDPATNSWGIDAGSFRLGGNTYIVNKRLAQVAEVHFDVASGSGIATNTVTHNLGTENVLVQVYGRNEASSDETLELYDVAAEATPGNETTQVNIGIVRTDATQYFKAIIFG